MINLYQNITEILLLQHAIGSILDRIAAETHAAHAASVITNGGQQLIINSLHLSDFPTVRTDCRIYDNEFTVFIKREMLSVSIGCSVRSSVCLEDAIKRVSFNEFLTFLTNVTFGALSELTNPFVPNIRACETSSISSQKHGHCLPVLRIALTLLIFQFFVVSEACALSFLDNFREVHDWVEQRYEKKVLAVIDSDRKLTYEGITDILRHSTVINDLPLTQIFQPNVDNDWIDVWSAFPYSSYFEVYNRFFLSNFSWQYDKQLIPKINNLHGLPVIGAFIHYPPYTAYNHVPPGTGNANLLGSNATLEIQLDGQEHIILVEFCAKYNCTLTAHLKYEEELWGESFHNHTGYGLVGAITMRDASVTCAALYLWDNTYEFAQYTAMIQRATITHIVPKPLPLPYWQTPILPFPGYIWGYVIGAFSIGAVTVYIVNATNKNMNVDEQGEKTYETYGLFDSIYDIFKIFTSQGISISTNFLSNILLFMVLLIYALVVDNLYAGGLASIMTVTRYEKPIDSLEKLVESKLLWGAPSLNWIFTLQQSDYPPHQKYVEKFIVKPIPEVFKLVQQHKMAVIGETMQDGTLSYQSYIDEESSKYYMIMKDPLYWQGTIIMTSKTWPFMEQLNRIVLMQQESGIRYYWEHRSAYRTMDYDIQRNIEENGKPPSNGEPVKLTVQHIIGALYLLLFGYITSTIFILLELLWSRNKKYLSKLKCTKPCI